MGVIRKTRTIEIVLNEFQDRLKAISTVELVKRLKDKINKTTVYRILEKLEDDGILHSVMGKDGVKRFARCENCNKSEHIDNHPHFQCSICGTVNCVNLSITIPEIHKDYKINSVQVLIQGECKNCKSTYN